MKLLGIDYGKAKVGLAVAEGGIPYPLRVIKFEGVENLLEKVVKIIKEEKIEKIILGISEGKMREETLIFANRLKDVLDIPVEFEDETLTSREAQDLSIKAGIKRIKRVRMEDAFAACVLLERYLDTC